ncbi:MAG: Asp-tRNA(Asn)/Glu-tRNA(Gln) amidotransferase subunit GatC [Erysipelotrichaceae bacterium]|nr:Asp-tRNA(Asn)/Glu-tRNA(Gln) amidotransferase subunit GatC [Erysipelotrichaceae bacterium]MCD8575052.1 Asp-tRNA(Asn)/Glu-tRNA(Gln) amidotransferase subunit GatC [Erysipelotrichaceae bacterium]
MNKDMILSLADELNFSLSESEVVNIVNEFHSLQELLALLETIDTEGVSEMVYPFESPLLTLRDDEVTHELPQSEALSNAYKAKEGYVSVPKVVK